MNGLLTEERALPRFDLFDPAHIAPAIDALLDAAEQAVAHARDVSPPSWEHFMLPLEDASERFARAWSQIAHLEAVANTPALREAYNTQLPRVTRFWSQVGQDRHLHAQYKRLAESDEAAGYDAARRRSLANTLRDFRLGGAELDDASKARYTQIREAMAETSARFSQNVLDATDAFSLQVEDESRLSGLPEDVVAACRAAAGKAGKPGWTLGLQMPVYLPVLTLADDRDLRETLYRANAVRASELGGNAELDNSSLIDPKYAWPLDKKTGV